MEGSGDRPEQVKARKQAFLNAFSLTGNVSAAARAAYIARTTPYGWAAADPDFKAAWEVAEQESIDRLEEEAFRRAHDGVERVRFSGGKMLRHDDGSPYIEREYSDTLMVLLLKAHRPDKYRERQSIEHSGPGGGPVRVAGEVKPEFVAEVTRLLESADPPAPAGGDEPVHPV